MAMKAMIRDTKLKMIKDDDYLVKNDKKSSLEYKERKRRGTVHVNAINRFNFIMEENLSN